MHSYVHTYMYIYVPHIHTRYVLYRYLLRSVFALRLHIKNRVIIIGNTTCLVCTVHTCTYGVFRAVNINRLIEGLHTGTTLEQGTCGPDAQSKRKATCT